MPLTVTRRRPAKPVRTARDSIALRRARKNEEPKKTPRWKDKEFRKNADKAAKALKKAELEKRKAAEAKARAEEVQKAMAEKRKEEAKRREAEKAAADKAAENAGNTDGRSDAPEGGAGAQPRVDGGAGKKERQG